MAARLDRKTIFPEDSLPDVQALIAEGRAMARTVTVGPSPFHETYGVQSEAEYKRKCMAESRVMQHAQIGFREPAKSQRAWYEVWNALERGGYRLDRFGICLDWSMGYPRDRRKDMPRGTGLIVNEVEDLVTLTHGAPVAPHYGDFVIGTPAGYENTILALQSGATSIGNLGQYFAFRQPHWDDDVYTTAEAVKAIALTAAQPVEIMVHSNLDDGFASLFTDLACSLGAILIEQHIVDELLGGHVAHCFGNTFSRPYTRLAFQRAAHKVLASPGTMVYGATTMYGQSFAENYAALANYLRLDAYGQKTRPSGHAINPVPVTEAQRIPDIDEIVDVNLFAAKLVRLEEPLWGLYDDSELEEIADRIVEGGRQFKANVLVGFAEAGIDTSNALEMLLAIRRIGSKRLEELYGPGRPTEGRLRGRMPVVRSNSIEAVEDAGEGYIARMDTAVRERIRRAGFKACLATTDVHEYGKILVETVLKGLGVTIIDGGTSIDPNDLAARVLAEKPDVIALSSYNGVALGFVSELKQEMKRLGLDTTVFIGGKLNRVPDGSNTSLPVDVSNEIAATGAVVCPDVAVLLDRLADMAKDRAA
ncbi:MAG: cobalamin-dependent protein [Alphaproteobacteria bacterium]